MDELKQKRKEKKMRNEAYQANKKTRLNNLQERVKTLEDENDELKEEIGKWEGLGVEALIEKSGNYDALEILKKE
jgi:hypothetical protein